MKRIWSVFLALALIFPVAPDTACVAAGSEDAVLDSFALALPGGGYLFIGESKTKETGGKTPYSRAHIERTDQEGRTVYKRTFGDGAASEDLHECVLLPGGRIGCIRHRHAYDDGIYEYWLTILTPEGATDLDVRLPEWTSQAVLSGTLAYSIGIITDPGERFWQGETTVACMDMQGEELWRWTMPSLPGGERAYASSNTAAVAVDGGIVIPCGRHDGPGMIVRLGAQEDPVWICQMRRSGSIDSLCGLPDGGIAALLSTYDDPHNPAYFLYHIDRNGKIASEACLAPLGDVLLHSLEPFQGGFLAFSIVFKENPQRPGSCSAVGNQLLRLSASGEVLWKRSLPQTEAGQFFVRTHSGGILVLGRDPVAGQRVFFPPEPLPAAVMEHFGILLRAAPRFAKR